MITNPLAISLFATTALLSCGSGGDSSGNSGVRASEREVLAAIGGCFGKACGPTTEAFFDNGSVATLKLTFSAEDMKAFDSTPEQWEDLLWSKWNSHCGPYEWIPVNLEYVPGDGSASTVLNKVGIRLRGSKSRNANPLAGFKLDFNEFLPVDQDRRFAGLSRFEALSNEKDNSVMVQCMTYKLMRDFGVEAPHCNHVRVIVNGKVYGLMESVERGKDKRYLDHHFGSTDGALYAASASCGYADSQGDLEYKGDAYSAEYAVSYEILEGTEADAEANLIPMLKCGDSVQTPKEEDFKACIKDWINVDEWLRLIAAESLAPTVEDFVGARRNFFMYFEPDAAAPHAGRMRIWGWDYDTALQRQACYPASCDPFSAVTAWYGPRGRRSKLIVRLTEVFKEQYCSLMKEFLDGVYLPEKVDAMAAVIQPSMGDDPIVTPDLWQAEVTKMRTYMENHRVEAKAAVEAACSATTDAAGTTAGMPGPPAAAAP